LVKSSLGQFRAAGEACTGVSPGHDAAQGRNGLTVPGAQRAKTESIRPILTSLIQINEAFSAFYTMA
jgi:hypothetical protein